MENDQELAMAACAYNDVLIMVENDDLQKTMHKLMEKGKTIGKTVNEKTKFKIQDSHNT